MESVWVTLFICVACYAYNRKSVSFVSPKLIEEGLDKSDAGLILTCQNGAFALSKFVAGVLSDRTNPRHIFVLGLMLSGSATILFSYGSTTSISVLCGLWFLNGMAQGCGWPSCAKIIRQSASPTQFGTLWSILSSANNFAGSLSPFVSSYIVVFYGWRKSVLTAGVTSLVFGVCGAFALKSSVNKDNETVNAKRTHKSSRKSRARKSYASDSKEIESPSSETASSSNTNSSSETASSSMTNTSSENDSSSETDTSSQTDSSSKTDSSSETDYKRLIDSSSETDRSSKRDSSSKNDSFTELPASGSLCDLLCDPFLITVSIGYLVVFCARSALVDWGQLYLIEERGKSHSVGSVFSSSIETGGLFGRIAAGFITDKLIQFYTARGASKSSVRLLVAVMSMAGSVGLLHALLVTVTDDSSTIWITSLGFMLGASLYGPIAIFGIVSTESAPAHLSGRSNAIAALAANLGAMLSGFPCCYLAKYYSWSTVFLLLEVATGIALFVLFSFRNLQPKFARDKKNL